MHAAYLIPVRYNVCIAAEEKVTHYESSVMNQISDILKQKQTEGKAETTSPNSRDKTQLEK